MSLTPGSPIPESAASPVDAAPLPPPRRWQGRLLTICFAIFTFEVGLFLVIFPWQDSWTLNYFQGINSNIEYLWDEPSFKGLVTGLGFVNIYIAVLQVLRLFRRNNAN
jgi:hypothetical protein